MTIYQHHQDEIEHLTTGMTFFARVQARAAEVLINSSGLVGAKAIDPNDQGIDEDGDQVFEMPQRVVSISRGFGGSIRLTKAFETDYVPADYELLIYVPMGPREAFFKAFHSSGLTNDLISFFEADEIHLDDGVVTYTAIAKFNWAWSSRWEWISVEEKLEAAYSGRLASLDMVKIERVDNLQMKATITFTINAG